MTTTATAGRVHHKPDEADRELLNQLQAGLALVREPYAEVGGRIGMDEEEVLRRLARLKGAAIVRQLSAIFDTRALGYKSSLVAARYPDDRLFDAAKVVGGHPGVSHNYRRTHAFNLWYTLAVEPDSKFGLEETMERLHEASGAESTRLLPTLKLYKINVQLDMTGTVASDAKEDAPRPTPTRGDGVLPTEADRRMIEVLQRDLPVEPRPFDTWADEAGVSPDELLEAGRVFVEHCYKRPTYPDWPYSIFTMVHARSKEACEEAIAAIAEETGITDPGRRAVLYSTYEFKKIRLMYFTPDYREWEDLALAGRPLPRWEPSR